MKVYLVSSATKQRLSIIVVVMLLQCLQSAARRACRNVTLDSGAAALLITPLLNAERWLAV